MGTRDKTGRRQLKVLLTWPPPRIRTRSPYGARQRGRSPSMRRSKEEAQYRDKLWEATMPRNSLMTQQGRGGSLCSERRRQDGLRGAAQIVRSSRR